MWKSSGETRAQLKQLEDHSRLRTCYALSRFWLDGIPVVDYQVSPEWETLVSFRPAAQVALDALKGVEQKYGRRTVSLVLFSEFYHTELLVDWISSNLDGISALLSHEIRTERIRFPDRFGRALYDRFNDKYLGTRTDHLPADAATNLLAGTPQGVYQIDDIVIGPLGVLKSTTPRFKPCAANVPLWHCSDTGCGTVHNVKLDAPEIPLTAARRETNRLLRDLLGRPSEWSSSLRGLHKSELDFYRREYADLPELIADCIIGAERTALFTRALDGVNRMKLRELIGAARKKKDAEGSAAAVASRLKPEEQLQLLLTLGDLELIELIDDAIATKGIRIPLGESRVPKMSYKVWVADADCRASALGVRSARDHEVSHLLTCIWDAYEKAGLQSELEWRVRGSGGRSLREALMEYVRTEGPAHVVKELILTSSSVTAAVCKAVVLSIRQVSAGDGLAVNRMLWKLGFNPDQYDEHLARLLERIREFRDTILPLNSITSEEDKEKARASGVNLFVSLEEFLEKVISYNVWLLSEDHFANQFYFEADAARRSVPLQLGASCTGPEGTVSWSPTSDNTLGTLLRYLSEAGKWIRSRADADRDTVLREERDFPFYAEEPDRTFPFRHTQLWADCDINELRRYADGFSTIERLLLQSDFAAIRNGLDHHRDESAFPTVEAMLACVSRLQEAVERADSGRYAPKPYWLQGRVSSRFELIEYEYRDYAGRAFIVYGPATVSGLPRQLYEHPVVIAPMNSIGYPNSQLLFRLREASEYSAYWEGYPRRRSIPGSAVPDAGAPST
jgi:hypothetical protein